MARVIVFNQVSVDGLFSAPDGDLSWAHRHDPEWNDFVGKNAGGRGRLLFGPVTYDMMVAYWPTPAAAKNDSAVAAGMNELPKLVFSRTLKDVTWKNTTLVRGELEASVRALKKDKGDDIVILGSGSIVAQLANARLIDEYQLITVPVVLGRGRTLFDGVDGPLPLRRIRSRTFENGNVLNCYEPG
jgi:dihydrofolate reductase